MGLPLEIERLWSAKEVHDGVIEDFPVGSYTGNLRNRLFAAMCSIVLEHHGGIITLIESGQHNGSALALLRPLIESTLRGFWIHFCAKEQKLTAVTKGEQNFPSFDQCRRAIEQHFSEEQHPGNFLMSQAYVAQLHSLTHTGIEAIQFRFDKNFQICASYPDLSLCTLLQQSSMHLSKLALAHIDMVEGGTGEASPRTYNDRAVQATLWGRSRLTTVASSLLYNRYKPCIQLKRTEEPHHLMQLALFIIFGVLAVAGALNLLFQRHPINSALSLVVTMMSLAVLYWSLGAEFLAAAQVIVYSGAVMVLFVFVIMLLNAGEEQETTGSRAAYIVGIPGAAAIFCLLSFVFLSERTALGASNVGGYLDRGIDNIAEISALLFTKLLLPFEVTSILILVAILGAVVLARKEQ